MWNQHVFSWKKRTLGTWHRNFVSQSVQFCCFFPWFHVFIHWKIHEMNMDIGIEAPILTVKSFPKWAVLKRSFISQGRKELLTPALTHHLRGHSASLRIEIPGFCLRASLRWLTHLRDLLTRTFLWPPPFLPHTGGFIAWLKSGPGPRVHFLVPFSLLASSMTPKKATKTTFPNWILTKKKKEHLKKKANHFFLSAKHHQNCVFFGCPPRVCVYWVYC